VPAYRLSRRVWVATVVLVLLWASALASLPASPARAGSFGDAVVAEAATHYGAPYEWGAAGPNTFDCSGLVMVVFGRFGIGLPHFTVDQYAASQHLAQAAKQPGDVIFFYDDAGYIYHDGIYAGNNMMIAATHTGDVVRQEAIWTGAYLVGRYPAPAGFGTPPPPPPVSAIGQHYAALGGPSSVLGAPVTGELATPDGVGRFVHYRNGSIYWTPGTGAWETHGAIRGLWAAMGWERTVLGYPVTDELGTPGGRGRFNHFQGGSIYWTPQTDAHEVHGAIRDAWAGMGWETSLLGFPVTNELGTPYKFGRFNHFEGGSVYWSPDTGAHEVHGDIRAAWAAMGWENSGLGFPVSSEYAVPGGRASDFQGGTLRWAAGTRAVTVG